MITYTKCNAMLWTNVPSYYLLWTLLGYFSFSLDINLFVQTKKSTSASLSSLNKVIHVIDSKELDVATTGVTNATNFFFHRQLTFALH